MQNQAISNLKSLDFADSFCYAEWLFPLLQLLPPAMADNDRGRERQGVIAKDVLSQKNGHFILPFWRYGPFYLQERSSGRPVHNR